MNQKVQKITREIERAKKKIADLEALLPGLERQKTELENAEIIKVFRTAEVAPADFADFIAAYRAKSMQTGTRPGVQPSEYPKSAPQPDDREELEDA